MATELLVELERFKYPQMWTLTIDATACPDQRRVYDWLKKRFAIGELVRWLYDRGLLESRDYFCADEFQMGERKTDGGRATEQVHFHLLLDVKGGFLSHATVQRLWNVFRPAWALDVEGRPPGWFGRVDFKEIKERGGMAWYLCAYMSKGPKEGLPDWFKERINEGHHCRLHSHSKGFFTSRPKKEPRAAAAPRAPRAPRRRLTLEQRHAGCRTTPALMTIKREFCRVLVDHSKTGGDGIEERILLVETRRRFVRMLPGTFAWWSDKLCADEEQYRRAVVELDARQVAEIQNGSKLPRVALE